MIEKLKPCPICKIDQYVYAVPFGEFGQKFACGCNVCGASTGGCDTMEEAENAWNALVCPEAGNPATENGCEWCAGNTEWQPDLLDGCKGGYRKPKFCPECGKKQDAVDHIGEATEMINPPLTLDELRARNEPVWVSTPETSWIKDGGYYCLCIFGLIIPPSMVPFNAGERNWVFYDRNPEGGQRHE